MHAWGGGGSVVSIGAPSQKKALLALPKVRALCLHGLARAHVR